MKHWHFIVDGAYYKCIANTGFVVRYASRHHLQNNKTLEENLEEFYKNIVEFNLYGVKPSTKDEFDTFMEKRNTEVL